MLCLTRYLNLMIGDVITANNIYWKLYLSFHKIVGVILSSNLNRGRIQNLTALIQKHNSLYITLFPWIQTKNAHMASLPKNRTIEWARNSLFRTQVRKKKKKLKDIDLGTTCNINLPQKIAIQYPLQLCYVKECCLNILGVQLCFRRISTDNCSGRCFSK